jgi:hypothetical protein
MQLKEVSIIQISPATGFTAVFADDDATIYTRPVACWTLVRRTLVLGDSDWDRIGDLNIPVPDPLTVDHNSSIPLTRVEGMISNGGKELEPCEDNDYFLGYSGPGENPLDFQDKARDLIDAMIDEDEDNVEDEDDDETDEEDEVVEVELSRMTDSLPQTLSHLSVTVQDRIRKGNVPRKWEQGGWLEFMKRFGDLSGG